LDHLRGVSAEVAPFPLQIGISVASMTWDAIEPVQNQNEESGPPPENKA
jgi:hypothetical protein